MASLLSLIALFVLVGLIWLIAGPPISEHRADLETLRRLTGKDRR
jgi:hypothetical protein